jgi:hypothetical protein
MLLANVIGDLVAIFIFKSLILVAIASILLLLLVFGWECTFSIKNFPYHTKQFYKWCRIYISLFNKLTHNRYERLVKNTKQFQIMSYHNNINPFENYSGSMNLSKPCIFASLFYCWAACCETWDYWDYFSIRTDYLGLCFILFILLSNNWFYTAIALNFMLLGIGRYIKGLPLGFGIDGILVLTYIALFMNKFKEK